MIALTDGLEPDVVIEAVGTPATFRMAVDEVAFTGRVVYIGYAKEPVEYETRLFVMKELDILGSRNALRRIRHGDRSAAGGAFSRGASYSRKSCRSTEAGEALQCVERRDPRRICQGTGFLETVSRKTNS